jgi:hypothetical protein
MNPLTGSEAADDLPADLRLQILTTEHWSLLSTRAVTWNEAFSRATMFLSGLSGAVVALALVAGATSFDSGFLTFSSFLLPVVLFVGVATFRRLVEINREDVGWVIGMNRLRHAYLEAAPSLRPYFVTGDTDDEPGIMTTFGAKTGPGGFVHEFVTTPGLIMVVNGVVAGALAAVIALRLGIDESLTIALVVLMGMATIALQASLQYRHVVRPRGQDPRFPSHPPDSSETDRSPGPRLFASEPERPAP